MDISPKVQDNYAIIIDLKKLTTKEGPGQDSWLSLKRGNKIYIWSEREGTVLKEAEEGNRDGHKL